MLYMRVMKLGDSSQSRSERWVIEGALLGTSSVLMSFNSSCCAGLKSMRCICSSRASETEAEAEASVIIWVSKEPMPFMVEVGTSTAVRPPPGAAEGRMESVRIGAEALESSGVDDLGGTGGTSEDCEGTGGSPPPTMRGGG